MRTVLFTAYLPSCWPRCSQGLGILMESNTIQLFPETWQIQTRCNGLSCVKPQGLPSAQ